jgi:hypothetical protein
MLEIIKLVQRPSLTIFDYARISIEILQEIRYYLYYILFMDVILSLILDFDTLLDTNHWRVAHHN